MMATMLVPVLIAITVRFIIPWENKINYVPVREMEPVPYETLIISPTDVLLINNDLDTIHLELINSINLAAEWEILIRQTR